MTDYELNALAESEGFSAALIAPEEVPVDEKFRAYCEENLCGQYNANYSCPPDCGSVEALQQTLLEEKQVLVLQTIHDIGSYENKPAVMAAKISHNTDVLLLMEKLRQAGYRGFCSGYNGCPLCDPCKRKENQPCAHPDKRISCMSAYCVDVAKLADLCKLEFAWTPGKLYLFGMIAFHKEEAHLV